MYFHSRFNSFLLSSLAMAAGFLVAGCDVDRSPRERLTALSGPHRVFAGRLYGDASYRPYLAPTSRRGAVHDNPRDVRSWIEVSYEIEKAALDEAGGKELNDLGVLLLAKGDHDLAIATLQVAIERTPTASAYNDLAVAYLDRFETLARPMDLLRAVTASADALSLEPGSADALFNRAQALSGLGLRRAAAAAWEEFAAAEKDEKWLEEGAAVDRRLDRATLAETWSRRALEIEQQVADGMSPEVEATVEAFPFHARVYAEETLLPRWARESRAGETAAAEAWLELAGRIGEALLRQRGEGLLHDAVTSAREAAGSAGRERLLEGLVKFGDGVAAYERQQIATAAPRLRDAAADLAGVGHPLAGWARFYDAVGLYYDDAEASHAALEALLAELPQDRYLALAGRALWILGTNEKVRGQVQSSVARSERALELLDRSSGAGGAAFVHVLLAESYSLLGEHDKGWAHRYQAFLEVPAVEGLRRNIAMWNEAAQALRRQDAFALAGPFVDEAVAVAGEWGNAIGLATASLQRASYRLETGDEAGAFEDLENAQASIADMEPGGLREQMQGLALVTEGLLHAKSRPELTVDLLTAAFTYQRATGYDFSEIEHLTVRASAHLRLGDDAAAEADFEQAIRHFEEIRATVEDPLSRMRAFRKAQPAFEDLLRLRLDRGDASPDELFAMAERARARALFDLFRARRGDASPIGLATLSRLAEEIPRGVVVAESMLLEDRLLWWVLEPRGSRLVEVPVRQEDLRRRLEALRLELERAAPEPVIRERSAELYDLLIRPLELPAGGETTLVVVPDRFLARVPWLVLFDRDRERYLVADHPVSVAPSATLFLSSLEESRRRSTESPSLLAVGVGGSVSYGGRTLPALEKADEETSSVAAAYARDGARIYTGPGATRDAFLAGASSAGVIHFAGHALADPEALARSVLLFHPIDETDTGALPLSRILELRLDRTLLVVLSGCQTLETWADDREGLQGLGGAFLAAGVPAVLASQWDVDDRFAARLMPLFHQRFAAGATASEALRDAVLSLMTDSIHQPSPADWANFMVLGGVGR